MDSKVSILHISDLHRSKGHEISNAALLSSLIRDRDRYVSETPSIKAPNLIIVSGDIIRGSTRSDGAEDEIKEQYEEAKAFLCDLATEFLGGERKKIVVIPGNHDVSFKFSKESMAKIDNDKLRDDTKWEYLKDSINQKSKIRWSWKDLAFYEITDEEKYKTRLKAFCDFYSDFYEGERHYSIEPSEQFDLFDFEELGITIAAFSSCYNNDHLRFVGDIHPDCIARAALDLRDYRKKGRLLLATWHHNTKGLPYDANYMDSSQLKNFIDSGIVIGFHGHQHKTELINEYSNAIEQKQLLVFSAGTLCGGEKELPPGVNRQYNVVEIIQTDEKDKLDVVFHMREKTLTSPFSNPIWTAGHIDSTSASHCTLKVEKPNQQGLGDVLLGIEKMMHEKNYKSAKEKLLGLDLKNEFVRKFLEQCITETEDFSLAISVFNEPTTDSETAIFLNAVLESNDKKLMAQSATKFKSLVKHNSLLLQLVNKLEVLAR